MLYIGKITAKKKLENKRKTMKIKESGVMLSMCKVGMST